MSFGCCSIARWVGIGGVGSGVEGGGVRVELGCRSWEEVGIDEGSAGWMGGAVAEEVAGNCLEAGDRGSAWPEIRLNAASHCRNRQESGQLSFTP